MKPSHLRNNFKLDSMNISWFPKTIEEAKTKCVPPKKKKEFIFNRYFYETKPIEVQCKNIPAFPPPHTFWVTPKNETFYSETGLLFMKDSNQEQSGVYTCEIINIVAKVQVKYMVTVYWTGSIIDCDGNIVTTDFGTDHIDDFEDKCQETWAARDAEADVVADDYLYGGTEYGEWEGDYDYGDGGSDRSRVGKFVLLLAVLAVWLVLL